MASYGIELTGKEIIYFFVRRKACPQCGETIKREKKVESIKNVIDSLEVGKFYIGERTEITITYRCTKCNKLYSISELANN